MNVSKYCAAGLVLAGLAWSTSALARDLHIDVQKKVLDNGVTVLAWERPSAGRIGARTFYKVDIAAERQGTIGLVHMLEHHLFKGTDIAGTLDWEAERGLAERVEIIERMVTDEENHNRDCLLQREVFVELEAQCSMPRLDALRAELVETTEQQNRLADITWYNLAVQSAGATGSTASTGRDWMKFDLDLPANKLELFLWTERARVENPVFRHFEPEKEVVVDQIRRYDNNPDGKFSRVLRSMTYDAHPYGYAHWFSDLTRATREDHWEIFYKYFIPQNLVVVVVGDIEAESVFAMTEAYFGDWQKGRPSPRLRTVEPEPIGQKRLLVEAAGGPAVAINVPMPAVGHDDAHVFDVLAELMGGPRGRLARLLVDEQQLATDAAASGWTSKYPSHFSIRVNARGNEQLDAIEAGINTVLAGIAAGTVSNAEISAAARRLELNLARNLDEIGRGAVTIGAMETIYDWQHLNALPGLWAAVTPADLRRVVQRYFDSQVQAVGHLRRTPATATAQVDSGHGRTLASLDTVRPGTWPAGGPVDEFFLAPEPKQGRIVSTHKAAPAPIAAPDTTAAAPAQHHHQGIVGLTDERDPSTQGNTTATVNTGSRATPADSGYGDPLAIAEQPWYAPPFMVERRPAGFAATAPTRDYRDLRYTPATFAFPDPSDSRIQLDNGLVAFVAPDAVLPMTQVTVLVDAPVTADPAGKAGVAALTADLLRKGTTQLDAAGLEAALNAMSATLTIENDRRGTRIHAIAPAAQVEKLLGLLGTMVALPDFAGGLTAERERHALRAERADDNALYVVQALFDAALYGEAHAMGTRPTPASIRAITLDDVRRFHAGHYSADRIAFVISGDVQRSAVENALRSNAGLTALPPSGVPALALSPPASPEGIRVVTRHLDTRQGLITLGHVGIEGSPDDHAALEVMHHILAGGGFTSRMMTLMRSETGVTSALYGEVEPGRGTANAYQWRFGGNVETLATGIEQALQEIGKMHREGVTQAEFEAARTTFIDGLIPASYDTSHKTAERLATKALFGLYAYQSPQYLNYYAGDTEQIEALQRLTVEDVNRAARKYLDPDNLVIAIAGQLDVIKGSAPPAVKQLLDW